MAGKASSPALPFKYLAFGEIKKVASNRPGWSFAITLRFGEEVFEFRRLLYLGLAKAHLSIGVKHASIIFSLKDCTLPDDDWEFDPAIETQRTVNRRISTAAEGEGETGAETEAGVAANIESRETGAAIKATLSRRTRAVRRSKRSSKIEIEDTFRNTIAYIEAAGGPTAPKWVIEAPNDRSHLQGTILKSRRFARAEIVGSQPQIEIHLEIPDHGLVVRDDNGIFRGINKQKIARIRIKKALSQNPHLLCSINLVDGVSQ